MPHPEGPGTVLVTGGAGFIGTALAARLALRATRWVVLDNLHPQVHPERVRPRGLDAEAEVIIGDVTDPLDLDRVLSGVQPDVIVHLAAETGTAQSLSESSRHGSVNVMGTTQLLDALTRIGHVPSHFVLTSSRAVYGEGLWERADGTRFQPKLRTHAQLTGAQWDHEGATHLPNSVVTTVPAPVSIYGATKLAQEHLLSSWAGAHDSAVSILRLQNVYGPGQSLSNPYTGIVSLFSQLARDGKSIPLYEDGEITRDFVYIDDVVDALSAAISVLPSDGFRLVDVGCGVRTTIRDLATIIAEHYGAPAPHVTGQFRDGDVRHAACDLHLDDDVLAWAPRWELCEGVSALQRWIASELPEKMEAR